VGIKVEVTFRTEWPEAKEQSEAGAGVWVTALQLAHTRLVMAYKVVPMGRRRPFL
jgi:hypothetical protein